MAGAIFALSESGALVEITERPYDSEALLQKLLAHYPNILAGDQIDTTTPRRWLLVAREAPLPSEEGGAGRWSVDHLFLDQDGVPTIVEVKRSSDTRIRREVVGQMIEYAANAVVYWPVESLRARLEERAHSDGVEPEDLVRDLVGSEADVDEFWLKVKTNLQAGRVRLVFVADVIPPELRRSVEFLNQQMDPAQVLAVEIKQFIGTGLKALVPRVIGQTATAENKKTAGTGGPGEPARVRGTDLFETTAVAQPTVQPAVRSLVDLAKDLERAGLATLYSKAGDFMATLLPRLPKYEAGLAVVYFYRKSGTVSVNINRTVLQRWAPRSLQSLDPLFGSRSETYDISPQLLQLIRRAYEEAAGLVGE